MSQIKGQEKTPEKQINEVETGNLPEKEIRIMIVKMIQDFRKTMEKMQEMFTKDLEERKNKQAETNTRWKMKGSEVAQSCPTLQPRGL